MGEDKVPRSTLREGNTEILSGLDNLKKEVWFWGIRFEIGVN
jgi:hypothetical protein